jgi:hypothetical protein
MSVRRHLPAARVEHDDEQENPLADFAGARERAFDQAAGELQRAFADVRRVMDSMRGMIRGRTRQP